MNTREPGRAERIPQHRIREAGLRLKDAAGRPLANTTVTVRQERHKFLFGCNIFQLNPRDTSEAQRAYQERFAALLNYATLPFYWGGYEKEPNQPDEERLLGMARWCREHRIAAKGHPLCWHEVAPKWHAARPLAEMRRLQMERIGREVGRFRGLIDLWDVVNEAVIMPRFARDPNHMTPLVRRHGVVPILKEAFAHARQANAQATLLLNDYDHTEAYEQLIERCLDAGVEINVIGIQSHMHQGYLGNEVVRAICERFARFGKPLHWTEATLISGDIRPDNDFHTRREDWPSTPTGEARQAEEVAAFYTTLYSHPAVEAITWWDFRDGCWLGAPSGLVREDLSPKPAYERLMKLIKGEWWFGEQILRTDSAGAATFHGVPGDYELAADGMKARLAHDRAGLYEVAFG
jgi:GH35 family endo-1,4-beta-xylanase